MHHAKGNSGGRLFRQVIGLFLLLAWNASLSAAGLGQIKVESGLNQVFLARIEVLLSASELVTGWTVKLGDLERYRSMGLKYPRNANKIRVSLSQLTDGKAEILLEGQRPVTEMVLDIVVTLDDGRSTQVRHYPVLIDFPDNGRA